MGDHEERRCLKTRHDGLADVNVPGDDDAVHRRVDRRVAKIEIGGGQRGSSLVHERLCDIHLCEGVAVIRVGEVEVGLGHEALLQQRRHAIAFPLALRRHIVCFSQVALCALERRACLAYAGLERLLIDLSEDLALCDDGIEVRRERGDLA